LRVSAASSEWLWSEIDVPVKSTGIRYLLTGEGCGAEIFKSDFKLKRRKTVDGGGKVGNGKGNDHFF
jgi:hypothetical protein